MCCCCIEDIRAQMFRSVLGHDYISSFDPRDDMAPLEDTINHEIIQEEEDQDMYDEPALNEVSLEEYNKTTATIHVEQEEEEQVEEMMQES